MRCFLDLGRLPVFCNVLWDTASAARAAPRGPMQLGFCTACGMIANSAYDPALTAYGPRYENSLHYSPRFQAFAEALADRLIGRYGLTGKRIVEIGAGDGSFLALLCARGGNRGLGLDPSGPVGTQVAGKGVLELVPSSFPDELAEFGEADLVCCRHTLEHVAQPRAWLEALRRAIGGRAETAVYLEVPSAEYMLQEVALWDVIYEHHSYFTRPALELLVRRAGFDVRDVGTSFGGQYLWLEALPRTQAEPPAERHSRAAVAAVGRRAASFARAARDRLQSSTQVIAELTDAGRAMVVWGAGSKGVTFLNLTDNAPHIEAAVDINPRKQGRYVPGTGHEVMAPSRLRERQPRAVLVLNPLYAAEVASMLADHGLDPGIVVFAGASPVEFDHALSTP